MARVRTGHPRKRRKRRWRRRKKRRSGKRRGRRKRRKRRNEPVLSPVRTTNWPMCSTYRTRLEWESSGGMEDHAGTLLDTPAEVGPLLISWNAGTIRHRGQSDLKHSQEITIMNALFH